MTSAQPGHRSDIYPPAANDYSRLSHFPSATAPGRPTRSGAALHDHEDAEDGSGIALHEAAGSSSSHQKSQANHEKVGNQFCEYIADNDDELGEAWGRVWLEVPEAEVATTRFFGFLADFLSAVRTIADGNKNAGDGFAAKSADSVFNGLLQSQKKRFLCSEGPAKVCPLPPPSQHRLLSADKRVGSASVRK